MKKLLTILLLLLLCVNSFSQSTEKKITIKLSTFDSMLLESVKCDSIRKAYDKQTKLYNTTISENIDIYSQLQEASASKIGLQNRVARFEDQLKKSESKNKPFALSVYFGYGASIIEQKIYTTPQIGVGVSYTIFRF